MTATGWAANGPAPLRIEVTTGERPGLVIARMSGELDYGNTHRFASALGDAPDSGADLVLDLDELIFCDSSALGALVALHKRVTGAGARLFLVRPRPQVADAIVVTSLDQLLRVRDSVSAVLAEMDSV
jgi:anti-sigma B factor antagonist